LCIGAYLNLRSKLAAIVCCRKLEFYPIAAEYLQYTSDFAVEFQIQRALESAASTCARDPGLPIGGHDGDGRNKTQPVRLSMHTTIIRKGKQVKHTNLVAMGVAFCAAMLIPRWHTLSCPKLNETRGSSSGSPSHASADVSCQRGGLQHAVRLYLAAQAKGDISILRLPTVSATREHEARQH